MRLVPRECNKLLEEIFEPLLEAASFQDGRGIIGILAGTAYGAEVVTQILERSVQSRRKWRVLIAGMKVMRVRNNRYPQAQELPVNYLRVLNRALVSRVKGVRDEAILSVLASCLLLHREDVGDRAYIQDDIRNVRKSIRLETLLDAAGGLPTLLRRSSGYYIERLTGVRGEYLEPFTREALLKVWPDASG